MAAGWTELTLSTTYDLQGNACFFIARPRVLTCSLRVRVQWRRAGSTFSTVSARSGHLYSQRHLVSNNSPCCLWMETATISIYMVLFSILLPFTFQCDFCKLQMARFCFCVQSNSPCSVHLWLLFLLIYENLFLPLNFCPGIF